jgi:diacylglycerol kinase (ATP)
MVGPWLESTVSNVRISLLYKKDAGRGVRAEMLRQHIERAGNQLIHAIDRKSDLKTLVADRTDMVVVAGGDGTVWRAMSALAGRGTPLGILPLGTANNIARSLGIEGSMDEIIDGWKATRPRPIDLGVARGAWGEAGFVEAVGSGLVSAGITAMDGGPRRKKKEKERKEDSDSRLARAVRCYRDTLSRLPSRRWSATVDGEHMDRDFILLEVLNIRSVGPNLVLAPDADPSDGWFDVVTAGEEHREAIDDYLGNRLEGREVRLRLPTRRARRVDIHGWEELHLDDQVCSGPSMSDVSISIEPAAVQVMA